MSATKPIQAGPLFAGKRGLIMGIANDRSLAWGIAEAVAAHGAELAVTYQGDAIRKRVVPLAERVGATLVLPADVTDAASMDALFSELESKWGKLDFVVHAIAFSDKEELKGRYVDTTYHNFQNTMNISVFSFTDLARRASALMPDGGSLLTLTYLGAERVVPHYNVMGVAKAALEASVRFLAVDLGGSENSGQCHLRRTCENIGCVRHRRFPIHLEVERVQRPLETKYHHRRRGRRSGLSTVGSCCRHHRRGPACRQRLSCRRHESCRRA